MSLFSCVLLAQNIEQPLIGDFSGRIVESNNISYRALLSFDSLVVGEVAGSTEYLELQCSSVLILEESSDSLYSFREQIISGSNSCADQGRIDILVSNSDSLSWEYYFDNSSSVTATAVFTRMIIDSTLVGSWQGEVNQPNFGEYPGEITIDSLVVDSISGTSSYSTLNCSGVNQFVGTTDSVHIFKETITDGTSCLDGRIEIYKVSNDTIGLNFYLPGAGTTIATGLYTRPDDSTSSISSNIVYSKNTIAVYPNPATEELFLSIQAKESDDITVSLIDALGRKVWTDNGINVYPSSSNTINIPIGNIYQGMYFISAQGKLPYRIKKVLIK